MGRWFSAFLVLLSGCFSTPEMKSAGTETHTPTVLTVYSGRGESMVGPLFSRIPEDAPFRVEVQYGKTAEVVTRLLTEGEQSPADVIFAQDSGHLGILAERGALAPLPESLLSMVAPTFRGSRGTWVGTSGRLRVLVYDTTKLGPETLPQSIEELALPKWRGKLGWAPTNGSMHAHVSALRHAWGEEKTRAWLTAVAANAPIKYPKNSPQVAAANDGAIEIGWVNHYYLHRLDKAGRRAANWSFPAAADPGNLLMVSGVGIRKNSPNTEAAAAFIRWLLSESVQTYFAQEGFEYPTRPGVAIHPDVRPLDLAGLASVEQVDLADLGPTRVMLTELGLL
jgi:iron(III) transport system substrate-binding protein